MQSRFQVVAPFQTTKAQKEAVTKLAAGYSTQAMQTLLGITGSGKTFVMANLIEQVQRPTLVLAHNKTLAAQLYAELREFFPHNRVEYFISYYDYYQPESYLPTTDTYIEKDASINEQIEKMRLRATAALLSRKDVIIVSSISCIYGLGDPEDVQSMALSLKKGASLTREQLIRKLIDMQYERNDTALEPGMFRVRGDIIDVIPAYEKKLVRLELFGSQLERIEELHALTGEQLGSPTGEGLEKIQIFPAKQFVVPEEKVKVAIERIKAELKEHLPTLSGLEAERLRKRTSYDIEMLREVGYCSGIENYSRHFDDRKPGEPPSVLLDYFPKDFLLIVDESHQTLPQARAMYHGDYSRKKNLVDFGFRLPCAYDNRPLKFTEFEKYLRHVVFVSATPAEYELKHSGQVVELIVRPTGLLDPVVEVRPIEGQIKDLIGEIRKSVAEGERVLITTLTKKMAEDLTAFLAKEDIKVRYLHSDVASLDRIELIRQLRIGDCDVLVGINLLREGLDIPEVALVAILDADKEGFLRDERSLIQTIGRAARNEHGRVILYAERMTDSMRRAIRITTHRRKMQMRYNAEQNITPATVKKAVPQSETGRAIRGIKHMARSDVEKKMIELEAQMKQAAERLDFEQAIELRDMLTALQREVATAYAR